MIKRDKWKRMSKMGFYNDRVAIADVNGKEIYLIRKQKQAPASLLFIRRGDF